MHVYYGSSHVLRGVEFRVAPGETVGLLGRNGMGKTTLLRALLGHVVPRRGEIRLRGIDATGARPERVAATVWPTCRKGAASSPTCRCGRTWSWPHARA